MTNKQIDNLIYVGLHSMNVSAVTCAKFVQRLDAGDNSAWSCCPDYMPSREFYNNSLKDIYHCLTEPEKRAYYINNK